MKTWFRLHRLALGNAIGLMFRTPLATVLNFLAIGITVALPLGLYTLLGSLSQITANLPTQPSLTIFLQRSAGLADVMRLSQQLKSQTGVRDVRHITKEEALQELSQSSGMTDLLAGLGSNPLPEALVVTTDGANPDFLQFLAHQAKTDSMVEDVQLDATWARRLQGLIDLGQRSVDTLTLLLGIGLALVAGNTIRMQILTRQEEIEVSKLMGATDSFIRRPFLYFALLQGLGGAVTGWLFVMLGLHQLSPAIDSLASLYASQFTLSTPSGSLLGAAFALTALLSLLGAAISVERHLRRYL